MGPPAEASKQKTRDSQSWAGETRDRGGARGDVVVTGLRGEPSGFHVIKIAGRPKENHSTNGCGSPPVGIGRLYVWIDRVGYCGPIGLGHIVHGIQRVAAWPGL